MRRRDFLATVGAMAVAGCSATQNQRPPEVVVLEFPSGVEFIESVTVTAEHEGTLLEPDYYTVIVRLDGDAVFPDDGAQWSIEVRGEDRLVYVDPEDVGISPSVDGPMVSDPVFTYDVETRSFSHRIVLLDGDDFPVAEAFVATREGGVS